MAEKGIIMKNHSMATASDFSELKKLFSVNAAEIHKIPPTNNRGISPTIKRMPALKKRVFKESNTRFAKEPRRISCNVAAGADQKKKGQIQKAKNKRTEDEQKRAK